MLSQSAAKADALSVRTKADARAVGGEGAPNVNTTSSNSNDNHAVREIVETLDSTLSTTVRKTART